MSDMLKSPGVLQAPLTPQTTASPSLPGFLLGTPKSPSRNTPVTFADFHTHSVPSKTSISTSPSRFTPNRGNTPGHGCNKENALPTESLYDSVLIIDKSVLHKTPERQSRVTGTGTPVTPGSRARSRSPARRLGTLVGDSMYEDPLADTWVTVFGFPANSSQFVLQHFSQFGKILKYENPSKGNWVHLMFESKIQARKALSRNGSTLNKDIMIGVVPCAEQRIKSSGDGLNTSIVHTPSRGSKKHEVAQHDLLLPYKDEGFLYRMFGYVFGW